MQPASETDLPNEPSVAGVKVRPVVAMVLYALLLVSAALALWVLQSEGASPQLKAASPWVFFAFAVGFTTYRLALVFARRYSPFKAFLQITVAALFFMQLLTVKPRHDEHALEVLLHDEEARVRALAAEVAGWRHDLSAAPVLVELLRDDAKATREAAHAALVKLNDGADLGDPTDDAAYGRWKARFLK